MKSKIITLILGIFLISFTAALYSGGCQEIDLSSLDSSDVVYTVEGNMSNLNGLEVTKNGSTASVCTVSNYKPDDFTIIFLDNSTKIVEKRIIKHSHNTRTKYIEKNVTDYIMIEEIEYIELEKVKNNTNESEGTQSTDTPKDIGFFRKIWNWIINLF